MSDDLIMQAIVSGWISMAEKAKNRMEDLKRERDDLESKLAKAVEALQLIAGVRGSYGFPFPETYKGYGFFAIVTSREALAELEGEPLGAEFEAVWDANRDKLYDV